MKSGKVVIIGSINVMGIVAITGLWYRPLPLPDSQENKSMPIQRKGYVSKYVLTDNAIQTPPKIYDLCRRVVVAFQVSISRVFMFHLGSLRIVVDDNYKSFVHALVAKDCETSVITVSNHRCLLDDAGLFSCLLPYWMNAQPRFLRNTLCAQEFCFNEQRALISAYLGLGKVLPIQRGSGIDQRLLLDFARLVAAGEWCHVFPEGGIFDLDTIGGRSNGREVDIGKLKWGVGKLIAHAPKPPIVIPFFHTGTEAILPPNPVTKKVDHFIPKIGHRVTIRFGEKISFDDLIEEHEKQHGPLWKFKASASEETSQDMEAWISKEADKELYSKIVRRIETALSKLNDESRKFQL